MLKKIVEHITSTLKLGLIAPLLSICIFHSFDLKGQCAYDDFKSKTIYKNLFWWANKEVASDFSYGKQVEIVKVDSVIASEDTIKYTANMIADWQRFGDGTMKVNVTQPYGSNFPWGIGAGDSSHWDFSKKTKTVVRFKIKNNSPQNIKVLVAIADTFNRVVDAVGYNGVNYLNRNYYLDQKIFTISSGSTVYDSAVYLTDGTSYAAYSQNKNVFDFSKIKSVLFTIRNATENTKDGYKNYGLVNADLIFSHFSIGDYRCANTPVVQVGTTPQNITFGTLTSKTYGDIPFALSASASSGLAVTYKSSNTSVATVSGNTVTIVGAGNTVITASQSGNSSYNAATNVTQTLTVNKASQVITFGALVSKKVGDAAFSLTGTASSGLAIGYVSSNTAVATISGSTVTIVGAGTTNITASQAGNTNYLAATSVAQTLTVSSQTTLQPQTIIFSQLATKTYRDASFTLGATSNSGLAVSYTSSNPAVATISGNTVTIVGAGNTVITASQAGSSSYNAAPNVTQTLTVNKASQTITFTALASKKVGDAAFSLTGTASSGLAISYVSSNTAVATISGSTVTIVGAGTTNITASQAGNTNYLAATSVAQTLTVSSQTTLQPQTITFNQPATKTYGDASFTLGAASNSGLAVSYSLSNTTVASISTSGVVTILKAGTVDITASQTGNSTYSAASPVVRTLTISQAKITVTADNKSIQKGAAIPSFTYTFSGFKNGETSTAVISGAPVLTTIATTASNPGSYPISIAKGSLSADNYTFDLKAGSLNITDLTIDSIQDLSKSTTPKVGSASAGASTTLGLKSTTKVTSVKLKYRLFTEDKWKEATTTANTNSYSYTFTGTEMGEIGLEYFFEVTMNDGQVYSDTTSMYKAYDSATNIPISNGTDARDYNLLALPYALSGSKSVTDVFIDNLNAYDKTQWRLFRYNTATQANEEYQQNGFTALEESRGYWLIVRKPITIDIPQGTAPTVTQTKKYEIPLKTGWNLIGNPYFFNLSWAEVMAENPGKNLELWTWNRGFSNSQDIWKKFAGAYVNSSSDFTLKIPTLKNTSIQARLASEETSNTWVLPISIHSQGITNRVNQIGMSKAASLDVDEQDLGHIPMPTSSAKLSFDHDLMQSFVPDAHKQIWESRLIVPKGEAVQLSWKQPKGTSAGIYLVIPSENRFVDMQADTSVSFSKSQYQLRFVYGTETDAQTELDKAITNFEFAPNPANKETHLLLNAGESFVELNIVDNAGIVVLKRTYLNTSDNLPIDISELSTGVYQAIIKTPSNTVVRRLVKN